MPASARCREALSVSQQLALNLRHEFFGEIQRAVQGINERRLVMDRKECDLAWTHEDRNPNLGFAALGFTASGFAHYEERNNDGNNDNQ